MTPRSKHIAIKYHHFKQAVYNGFVKIVKVNSEKQLADIFTKGLGTIKFQANRLLLCGWWVTRIRGSVEIHKYHVRTLYLHIYVCRYNTRDACKEQTKNRASRAQRLNDNKIKHYYNRLYSPINRFLSQTKEVITIILSDILEDSLASAFRIKSVEESIAGFLLLVYLSPLLLISSPPCYPHTKLRLSLS